MPTNRVLRGADVAGGGRGEGRLDRPAERQDQGSQARLGGDEEATREAAEVSLVHRAHPSARLRSDTAGKFCKNRRAEWVMAGATVLFGFQTLVWPDSIAQSAFSPILNVASPELIAFVSLVSSIRLLALYLNGRMPFYGPLVRAVFAGAGFCVMTSMALALCIQTIEVGRPPSPGVPFYLAWAVAEWLSAVRAASDVRFRGV